MYFLFLENVWFWKETVGSRRFQTVRPQERLLDSNWQWGLYSVEWDPGVEISSVKCEGGNTEGENNGCCTGSYGTRMKCLNKEWTDGPGKWFSYQIMQPYLICYWTVHTFKKYLRIVQYSISWISSFSFSVVNTNLKHPHLIMHITCLIMRNSKCENFMFRYLPKRAQVVIVTGVANGVSAVLRRCVRPLILYLEDYTLRM